MILFKSGSTVFSVDNTVQQVDNKSTLGPPTSVSLELLEESGQLLHSGLSLSQLFQSPPYS